MVTITRAKSEYMNRHIIASSQSTAELWKRQENIGITSKDRTLIPFVLNELIELLIFHMSTLGQDPSTLADTGEDNILIFR